MSITPTGMPGFTPRGRPSRRMENTKKHLSTSTRVEGWSYTFAPAPAEALPTTTFRDAHRLRHNGTSLTLKYYGPAHTDSDISVVFEEADVIQVGDTWW